jgi:hypothetical protein
MALPPAIVHCVACGLHIFARKLACRCMALPAGWLCGEVCPGRVDKVCYSPALSSGGGGLIASVTELVVAH